MPFDRISPRQMLWMRIATGATFVGVGVALSVLAGTGVFAEPPPPTRFSGQAGALFLLLSLLYGAHLVNAGLMLLELVTPPPFRMAINVPFVAANFQSALVVGLVSMAFVVLHTGRSGEAAASVLQMQALVAAGFVLNLVFVMMTKAHWNFTANTGKVLP